MGRSRLAVRVTFSIVFFIAALLGTLLITAGSWHYWQAWVFCGVTFVLCVAISFYLLVRDPEFLERRMRTRETERPLRITRAFTSAFYFIGFIIPGLDHRFGWSHVPVALVLVSDAIMIGSYLAVFRVFAENRFAAATIEVEAGQQVVSTGPYAIVRHPMYAAAVPMLLFTPLALGSYWALIPFVAVTALVVVRLIGEEQVLLRDLPGYDEYRRKVRYRLIPYVW